MYVQYCWQWKDLTSVPLLLLWPICLKFKSIVKEEERLVDSVGCGYLFWFLSTSALVVWTMAADIYRANECDDTIPSVYVRPHLLLVYEHDDIPTRHHRYFRLRKRSLKYL